MPARHVDILDYSLDLESEVRRAAAALREGELVILPMETVYGIAAKPSTAGGLARLNELRAGSAPSPLTPHLPDVAGAAEFIGEASAAGRRLMQKLWPGPVGLMFTVPAEQRVKSAAALEVDPRLIYNADGQVVLRCPDEPLTQSVLRAAGQPVVVSRAGLPRGSDANRAPTGDAVPSQVSVVLDAGPSRFSKPSTVVRVDGESWEIVREGIYDRRMIERMLRTTVLFVCSGNTCRSPMAMALARKLLAEHVSASQAELGERGFDVISAGTSAMPGMRATPQASHAVAEMGADLGGHRSQPLTVELIHRADVIVTMSQDHFRAVTTLVPSATNKTLALDPRGDVEDPIGSDADNYRRLAGEMVDFLKRRLDETVLKSA